MSKDLTAKQAEIVAFIVSESTRLNRGIGFRDIAGQFDIAVNAVTGHIKAIRDKTGKERITWEDTLSGGIKPNSLRSATMAVTNNGVASQHCRNGSGYSIVVIGEEVAFTLFSEVGIVRHDRIALHNAIELCDSFKIPAELSTIDRIAKLAERQAAKAANATKVA